MINIAQRTSTEINIDIANRIRRIRRRKKISQEELSKLSGVSFGSIKRFEQTGEISLASFTKIAIALRIEGELENLFCDTTFDSIEEVLNG